MSYIGKTYTDKKLPKLNWNKTALVLVTGSVPNTCGHALLYVGGYYFHFDGPSIWNYPRMFNSTADYNRFLLSNGKHELIRKYVEIPYPEKAQARLFELLNRRWATLVVSHNCASFVAEILAAGGNTWTVPQHCPVLELTGELFWAKVFGSLKDKLKIGAHR